MSTSSPLFGLKIVILSAPHILPFSGVAQDCKVWCFLGYYSSTPHAITYVPRRIKIWWGSRYIQANQKSLGATITASLGNELLLMYDIYPLKLSLVTSILSVRILVYLQNAHLSLLSLLETVLCYTTQSPPCCPLHRPSSGFSGSLSFRRHSLIWSLILWQQTQKFVFSTCSRVFFRSVIDLFIFREPRETCRNDTRQCFRPLRT